MSVRAACYGEIARPGFCMPVRVKEAGIVRSDDGRETYYVSVGGKEIVKDKGATPYELEIRANEEELYRLQDLFEELASLEEAEVWHFLRHPYETASTEQMSAASGDVTARIYDLLHELGTPETKAFIEQMRLS
ncbi:MAG: hypothetical protein C6W55_14380 [Thermobacillus sp.]|uniref:Uncharacterized protein n=1 Tax=Thermobacillus composti (strain DSM 18247 / JCM 13945 / KWC4) TaxID=717605 RepID=L0EFX0_THECK|nr:hypothetical protein Theco_2603 [Thermobacillus composti KWC4]REK53098.1 MAG: hypothetical protein C6W55_14380 [Thermobacillus sp.]